MSTSRDIDTLIFANWNYAGTERFVSHEIIPNDYGKLNTFCGLRLDEKKYKRGDWQVVDIDKPSCKRCPKGKRNHYRA